MMPLAQSKGSSPNWERQSLPGESECSEINNAPKHGTRLLRDGLMSVVNGRQCSWQYQSKASRLRPGADQAGALFQTKGRKCNCSIDRS